MKFILPFLGLILGLATGWLLATWTELHWFLAAIIGFGVFVGFVQISERRLRATAEQRALKAFERARR